MRLCLIIRYYELGKEHYLLQGDEVGALSLINTYSAAAENLGIDLSPWVPTTTLAASSEASHPIHQ